jgi:BarA-like signal transduction histidine kinase
MALFPVVAGVPWLAGVIGSAFASISAFLSVYLFKRLAIITAASIVIVGLTLALFAAVTAGLSGILVAVPSQLAVGAALLLPDNLSACISVLVSTRLLLHAYDWQVRFVQMKLF